VKVTDVSEEHWTPIFNVK